MDIKLIGVVGAGQMGSGIAEIGLSSGFRILMRDITPEALERGRKRIATDLERRVQKGKMTAEGGKSTLQRLSVTPRLEDLKDCDLVIEAASEQIPLKKEIFQTLDRITRKEVILASNTSSISISRIASFTTRPDRVVGMHFFNPAPVMKLIESSGAWRPPRKLSRPLKNSASKWGKAPWKQKIFPDSFPAG